MSSKRSPVRLVFALSVAGALAIFLIYTSLAGGGTLQLRPSQLDLRGHATADLTGRVVGPVTGDAHGAGLRFRLRDVQGTTVVPVVYRGTVPDQFKVGRDVVAHGSVQRGVFVATGLLTKCPSKYSAKKS